MSATLWPHRARRRARLGAAGGAFVVAALAAIGWRGPAEGSGRHVVEIVGFAFRPAALRVRAGDTVVWINRDVVPHTATGSPAAWDSGELGRGESWSFVPAAPGEFAYVCAFHPSMQGKLVVR